MTISNNQIHGNVGVGSSRNMVFSGNGVSGDPFCSSPPCDGGPTLFMDYSSNVTVSNNYLTGSYNAGVLDVQYGIGLRVLNNTVHCNICYAIALFDTNNSLIQRNRVSGGGISNGYSNWDQGIVLQGASTNAQILANNVTQEQTGIRLSGPTTVSVDHNNLVNNTIQAQNDQPGKNSWDNGYPSGGNYWSDFKGVDQCGGPQQNICPFPDGIGDTPYIFNSGQDRYPMIAPFVLPSTSKTSHASISISKDTAFTAANGVTRGSGMDADPYVIAGWSIISDFGSIRISNTTAFFVIDSVSVGNGFGGIILHNVTNARVVNSSVSTYCYGALAVSSSRNVVLAYNYQSSG